MRRSYLKEPVPVPCKICYQPLKANEDGLLACPIHGVPPKEKEKATRKALGPRLGHPKPGGHKITTPSKQPRSTGAALQGGDQQ